jgi:hypothetical protein
MRNLAYSIRYHILTNSICATYKCTRFENASGENAHVTTYNTLPMLDRRFKRKRGGLLAECTGPPPGKLWTNLFLHVVSVCLLSLLSSLAEREPGTARLEEAVTAYRDALLERRRERVPLE